MPSPRAGAATSCVLSAATASSATTQVPRGDPTGTISWLDVGRPRTCAALVHDCVLGRPPPNRTTRRARSLLTMGCGVPAGPPGEVGERGPEVRRSSVVDAHQRDRRGDRGRLAARRVVRGGHRLHRIRGRAVRAVVAAGRPRSSRHGRRGRRRLLTARPAAAVRPPGSTPPCRPSGNRHPRRPGGRRPPGDRPTGGRRAWGVTGSVGKTSVRTCSPCWRCGDRPRPRRVVQQRAGVPLLAAGRHRALVVEIGPAPSRRHRAVGGRRRPRPSTATSAPRGGRPRASWSRRCRTARPCSTPPTPGRGRDRHTPHATFADGGDAAEDVRLTPSCDRRSLVTPLGGGGAARRGRTQVDNALAAAAAALGCGRRGGRRPDRPASRRMELETLPRAPGSQRRLHTNRLDGGRAAGARRARRRRIAPRRHGRDRPVERRGHRPS